MSLSTQSQLNITGVGDLEKNRSKFWLHNLCHLHYLDFWPNHTCVLFSGNFGKLREILVRFKMCTYIFQYIFHDEKKHAATTIVWASHPIYIFNILLKRNKGLMTSVIFCYKRRSLGRIVLHETDVPLLNDIECLSKSIIVQKTHIHIKLLTHLVERNLCSLHYSPRIARMSVTECQPALA